MGPVAVRLGVGAADVEGASEGLGAEVAPGVPEVAPAAAGDAFGEAEPPQPASIARPVTAAAAAAAPRAAIRMDVPS
jgi:hypothetical protein